MCRLRNIALLGNQERVATGQTLGRTDRRSDRHTPDEVIPVCRYASQATQKVCQCNNISNHLWRHGEA